MAIDAETFANYKQGLLRLIFGRVGCGLWLCTEWIAHGRQLITGRHVATTCNLDVVPRDFLAETFGYESNLVLSHFVQHRNGSGFWLVAGSLSTQQVCVRPGFQLTRAVEQDVFFWNNDTWHMHTNIITKSRSIFRVYAGCSFTSLQSSSELVRKSGSTGFIDRTGRTRVTRDVRFRLSGEIYKLTWRIDPWLSPPANADCDSVDLKSFLAFHQAGAMTVASQHLSRKDFCSSVKQFSFTVFCILKAVWENQPPAVRRFAGCPEAPMQMQLLGVAVAQRFVSGNVRRWLAVTPDFVLQKGLILGWRTLLLRLYVGRSPKVSKSTLVPQTFLILQRGQNIERHVCNIKLQHSHIQLHWGVGYRLVLIALRMKRWG